MSKVGKIALYAAKQYAKEQERKRKLEEKEQLRIAKERAANEERTVRRKIYEKWCQNEESWQKIFDGILAPIINWEEKLVPRVFKEPERPKTDNLLEQSIDKVKSDSRNKLIFLLIVSGVFLLALSDSKTIEEFGIYGGGSIFSVIGVTLKWRWYKRELIKLEDHVLVEKKRLEDEYIQIREKSFNLHKVKEEERIAKITALLQGEEIAIKKTADHYLNMIRLPSSVSFEVKTLPDQNLQLDIHFPGFEVIQSEAAEWEDKRGIVKFSPKNQKEIMKQYERLMSSVVLRSGWEILRSCPVIKGIYVRVNTGKHHRTKGFTYEGCILSCILNRKMYYEIDFRQVEYIIALENFQLRYSPRGTEMPGDITPHSPHHELEGVRDELLQIDVDAMNGDQFEDFIKILVERMGLKAEKTKKSHDGGIDIWAYSDHELTGGHYIIQCKRWRPTISVDIIRDLYGAVTRERADKGILITNSKISPDCFKFVEDAPHNVPITLIQGSQLKSLIQQYGMAE